MYKSTSYAIEHGNESDASRSFVEYKTLHLAVYRIQKWWRNLKNGEPSISENDLQENTDPASNNLSVVKFLYYMGVYQRRMGNQKHKLMLQPS